MKRLKRFVGKEVMIIEEKQITVTLDGEKINIGNKLIIEGVLEKNSVGFKVKNTLDGDDSTHYFSSHFLKAVPNKSRGIPESLSGIVLILKDGFDSSKPPSIRGFQKRIRIKPLAK